MDVYEVKAMELATGGDIPADAWAFRIVGWHSETGETSFGLWHRTHTWVRRDGTYSGKIAHCGRVYVQEEVELVGAVDVHPLGMLCKECFGIDHSDKVTGNGG